MAYAIRTRDQHFENDGKQPKRILALDGGGLRGILTVAVLQRIEDILRERHGGSAAFRLCDYFDLIAGTSTGAIIAAGLATGLSVEEIRLKYLDLGERVFEKTWLRDGVIRAKYDDQKLIDELKQVYGAGTTLRSSAIRTGLLIVTKRLDTGSPWPISNNPNGRYFATRPSGSIGNGDYPLWQAVRASTAAPSFFDPQSITIAEQAGHPPTRGEFVDGAVSPYNNPALQAFMYATLEGYRVCWPTGADKLLLVSVGTGDADPRVASSNTAAGHAIESLKSLMNDCSTLQEILLQWMSSSPTARAIDRELGDLRRDALGGRAHLSYLRYNALFEAAELRKLKADLTDAEIESINAIDAPENMALLHRLGEALAVRDVQAAHFSEKFDLPRV